MSNICITMSNKNNYIGCRVDDEFLENTKKVMDLLGEETISDFIRNTILTMVTNAREKGYL